MNVNHSRAHVFVPQKLLHGSDIIAILKQTGSERVAQGVRTGWLRDTSLKPRVFDDFLEDAKFGKIGNFFSLRSLRLCSGQAWRDEENIG